MVLRLHFELDDLAALRFGVSPLVETVGLLRRHGVARARAGALGLDLALELLPPRGYVPDFLTPAPVAPGATRLGAELERVRSTPPEVVREQLFLLTGGDEGSERVEALRADPERVLPDLCAALERLHAEVVAPVWPRLERFLTLEVERQGRRLVEGGHRAVLGRLHPDLTWDGDRLVADLRFDGRFGLEGRGLLLVPSASWPSLGVVVLGREQPMVIYPAPGIELLRAPARAVPAALADVLGRTRARLLDELEHPATTSVLAARLGLTAPGISQHLQRLARAGIVAAVRDGREVHYALTPTGRALLLAARPGRRPPAAATRP